MTREEKLQHLIKDKYKSVREFSRESGIPNSTLNSMFKKGIGGTGIDTVMIVCHVLGITPDDLIDEPCKTTLIDNSVIRSSTDEALLSDFHKLNHKGREAAQAAIKGMTCVPEYTESETEDVG